MRLLRASLRAACLSTLAWAAVVAATGGFQLRIGTLRFSARQPDNALLVALAAFVALIAAARLDGPIGLAGEWAWWRRAAHSAFVWPRAHAKGIQHAIPALVALVVGGAQVYLWTLAAPLWLDEEAIALIVREHSFTHLMGPVWLGTAAPLGWLAAERAAFLGLGPGEVALRLVPVLFGIATLAAAVWIGRRWMSPIGATTLVVFCACNQWLAHYWFEAKQYSADACCALVLPAMAVWAMEADTDGRRIRRAAFWWAAAAIGQWFAYSGPMVTPACAVILLATSWRVRRRVAGIIAALGLMWVAAILLHYQVSVRYTLHSSFYEYWNSQFPPASGALGWMFDRLAVLSIDPGGTALWVSLWTLALGGFLFASNRALGIMFATVPLSAFLLAWLRIVPLYGRFALWIVPALAVGVALALDRAVRTGREAVRRRDLAALAIAAATVAVVGRLGADVIVHGAETFRIAREGSSKQGLDDREAVRWLMAQRQPGDAIVTTPLGWPAVWWYGDIPIGNGDVARGILRDGGTMIQIAPYRPGLDCDDSQLRNALKGQRRVLVYLGFPDFPNSVRDLMLRRLAALGSSAADREFADRGRVVAIDLRAAGAGGIASSPAPQCFTVQPAVPGGAQPTGRAATAPES